MYTLIFAAMQVAAPADFPPTFTAVSPADERRSGRIVQLNPDFSVVLTAGLQETKIKDVFSLRRTDRPLLSPPTGPHLITTTGDRIAGSLLGGDAQSLKYLPSGLNLKVDDAWKVPLSWAAVVWLTATPADTPIDPMRYDWLAGNRNRDVFHFRNGDTDRGTLAGLDPDAFRPLFAFRPEQGAPRNLRGDELAAVGFNPALARTRKPKGAYAQVILTDSSRLYLLSPTITAGVLSGETLFGLKVQIPVSDILSLDVLQGKATYLSDLRPKKAEQTGFLSVTWPWVADRNVKGTSLRVETPAGKSAFDKGLGTHPHSVLTYDLGGKYRRFEALVGLDPEAGFRGRASLRILVDGKEQDIPGLATLQAGNAIPIRVNVQGAKELILVTDFGTAGGVGADVNWCEARVVE
jgi:hypothetical protein